MTLKKLSRSPGNWSRNNCSPLPKHLPEHLNRVVDDIRDLEILLNSVCLPEDYKSLREFNEPLSADVVVYNSKKITQMYTPHIHSRSMSSDNAQDYVPAPTLPPRKVSVPGRYTRVVPDEKSSLRDAEWYWPDIKREDVNELLNDTVDGTFLVRDASNKVGEYTLTLRKGGANKLIRICHRDGKYGFTEPYLFNSVVDLINHFRNASLSQYNASLNIRLLYPVSRFNQEEETAKQEKLEKLVDKLIVINENLVKKKEDSERVSKDFNETSQEVQTKRLALLALKELVKVFQEQTQVHQKLHLEAQPHEIRNLEKNYEVLEERLNMMRETYRQLEEILQRKEAYNRTLERELTSIKPEIHSLRREREKYIRWLQQRGFSPTKLNQLLNRTANEVDMDSLPHNDEKSWLLLDCSRTEAEKLLENKPDGTFLIRKSRNIYKYALSIVCNGSVNHCIIERKSKGFGFADPYYIYPTLKDLVLHYATNSLEIHNDSLNTCLKYPIEANNSFYVY